MNTKKWYNEKCIITFASFPKLNYIIKVSIFIHNNNNSVIVKKNSVCDRINPSHFLWYTICSVKYPTLIAYILFYFSFFSQKSNNRHKLINLIYITIVLIVSNNKFELI